ncbi:MAG: hypoxanthine phosphoribosyltransferase [Acidobacteriota bacterium]
MMHPPENIGEILFSPERIQDKVRELGALISNDYQGKDPVVISMLRGAAIFTADLVRAISIPLTLDFMAISSYDGGHSSGAVKILKDLEESIEEREVIVVEDIVATGLTLSYLLRSLQARNPAGLKVCTLLDRPVSRIIEIPLAYRGFEVPDVFVVGYGLDFQQHYRNLPFICRFQVANS